MAQAFFDGADEATRDELARLLFYRDLETIRRPKPLFDPSDYPVSTLAVYDHGMPRALTPAPLRASQVAPIQIDDDDEKEPDPAALAAAQVDPPPLSGPKTDIKRINVAGIRTSIGYTQPFESQFQLEVGAARNAGKEHLDQESVFDHKDWKWYLGNCKETVVLVKGFPMLEDVVFVLHPNYWLRPAKHGKRIPNGNCYWLSLALLLYGNASCWLRVKAEHLSFLEKVLMDENHPRHEFYTRENLHSTRTKAIGKGQEWEGQVNLWEKLHLPGCWMNEDICILTADVYGVVLVLYKYDVPRKECWQNKIYDLKTFGAYNNRHIFMCYTHENHFQPMVPNDYYSYEFQLPRLTISATKRYNLVTGPRKRPGDGPKHYWRGPTQAIPCPLSQPSFTEDHLKRAGGYETSKTKPAPDPSSSKNAPTRPAPSAE
ncbi:hypothetical protein C8A05DRAFT_17966, partial [Staphylotrichum tortipilum]